MTARGPVGAPWHRREPSEYRGLARAVAREFPDLRFEERGERVVLAGELQIEEAGRVLDRFEIELELHPGGPRAGIPTVREVGGRVRRGDKSHLNPDGTACVAVPDELWYRHPGGVDLLDFLHGPVRGYFIGQSIVARGGAWPYGERAHGARGVVEFYGPLLGTTDPRRVHAFLEVLAARKARAHWRCPCDRGGRLRDCHGPLIRGLRARIPRRVFRAATSVLKAESAHLRGSGRAARGPASAGDGRDARRATDASAAGRAP